jgi:uncharacterized membrane protein YebE (DUF533 family)
MSLNSILDQILREGFGERKASRDRLDQGSRSLDQSPGIDRVVAQIQQALAGAGAGAGSRAGSRAGGGAAGSLGDRARDFLKGEQAKGLTGGQIGGIGAAAGMLLGGGLGGAVRGGALAVLGTLAYTAYQRAQGGQDPAGPEAQDLATLTGPETERLLVRAMISAAKADGKVSQAELDRILGKLSGDEATAEEKAFVFDQLSEPATPAEIAAEVSGPAQAAEVYAASIMAVDGDSEAERRHLRDLAQALRLDPETVRYLHDATGAPRP